MEGRTTKFKNGRLLETAATTCPDLVPADPKWDEQEQGNTYERRHRKEAAQAQRPSSAMRPAPRTIHPIAYASFPFEAFSISVLNRNSCAINYTTTDIQHRHIARNVIRETYLDETRVQEDTAGERVQDAAHDVCGRAVGVVRLADSESNCDAQRCGDTKKECTDHGNIVVFRREPEECEPRADTKTFECFCDHHVRHEPAHEWECGLRTMEDEYDKQNLEFVAPRDGECQTNKDTVEEYTKLENRDADNLCAGRVRNRGR